jgi:hypothetical protein
MKTWKNALLITVTLVLVMAVGVFLVLAEPPVRYRIEYYSDDNNYVTVTGTVSYLKYSDDGERLFLSFDDLCVAFQESTFVIEGENLRLLQQNGIDEKMKLGTQVTFISATRVFWDGYNMPIVGLSVNGESLLEFEKGKVNLLALLKE